MLSQDFSYEHCIKAISQLHLIEALFHAQHWFCANINQLLWLSLR